MYVTERFIYSVCLLLPPTFSYFPHSPCDDITPGAVIVTFLSLFLCIPLSLSLSRDVKQATVAEPTGPVSMELQEQPESESALAHPASQEAPEASESRPDEVMRPSGKTLRSRGRVYGYIIKCIQIGIYKCFFCCLSAYYYYFFRVVVTKINLNFIS